MEEENPLWVLIGRKLSGEASEKDLQSLDEILQKNPDAVYYMEILSTWWKVAERHGEQEAEKTFNKLLQQITKENTQPTAEQIIWKSTKSKAGILNFLKETFMFKPISKRTE